MKNVLAATNVIITSSQDPEGERNKVIIAQLVCVCLGGGACVCVCVCAHTCANNMTLPLTKHRHIEEALS